MKQSKNTKRAFLGSVISLAVCAAMLVGTTFAWFTDSASVGVSSIKSGKLDIALVNEAGDNIEGTTLEFVKAAGHEDEDVLWEPGCTYSLPNVYVKNDGNLALKYKLSISGINGDEKLNEAIDWTINGVALDTELSLLPNAKSDALTITGHMKEDAGNEYQGLSITGVSITVIATQDTVEYDSKDNQYDANAEYGGSTTLTFENGNVDSEGNDLFTTGDGIGTVTTKDGDLILNGEGYFGPYTYIGKYIPAFPTNGYTVSACVYIDPAKVDKGFALDYTFKVDDSVGINEQFVGVSRNTTDGQVYFSANWMDNNGTPALTEAGYYTIKWNFTDDAGIIRKTISIEDSNKELFSTTDLMKSEDYSGNYTLTSQFIKGGSFIKLFAGQDDVQLKSLTVENNW